MAGRVNPPYYLSAYGLAVQRGFVGTVDQWLASLKGEKGDLGDKVELLYLDDKIQWRWIPDDGAPEEATADDDEWKDLIDVSAIRGDIIEQTLNTATTQANKASAMATSAGNAASAAQIASTEAANSATAAGKAADEATSAANAAVHAANSIGAGILVADYGSTTFAAIQAAVSAGKSVSCKGTGFTFPLVMINDTAALFAGVANPAGGIIMGYSVNSSNVWTTQTTVYKKAGVVDANSTNDQVPTARAVYDALAALEQKIPEGGGSSGSGHNVSYNEETGELTITGSSVAFNEETGELTI